MKLPTIDQLAEGYIHMPDQTRQDIQVVTNNIVTMIGIRWAWGRVVPKVVPVLGKVRNGEQLTSKDARLLLTAGTIAVYLGARNAYAGWDAARKTMESAIRLGEHIANKSNESQEDSK